MDIAHKLKTFAFILRRRPFQAFELAQFKLERAFGVSLFFLSPPRLATRAFELLYTRGLSGRFSQYGNYYLAPSLIPERPVVLSFGVGQDIAFDKALLERHEPKLFLFDPTPRSRQYIESLKLPSNARFFQMAVTDRDGRIDVYTDELARDFEDTSSVSIFNRGYYGTSAASVECRKLRTITTELGIGQIDILKLDIEGAAILVLHDMLRDGIRPTQIACELERPNEALAVIRYLREVAAVFSKLRAAGYQIYRTRATDKGFQIEVLAVKG